MEDHGQGPKMSKVLSLDPAQALERPDESLRESLLSKAYGSVSAKFTKRIGMHWLCATQPHISIAWLLRFGSDTESYLCSLSFPV